MKSQKISILKLAARNYSETNNPMGMMVDWRGWPPSNRGEVKHLLRKGYLTKVRIGSKSSRRSMVRITEKGLLYLQNNGIETII